MADGQFIAVWNEPAERPGAGGDARSDRFLLQRFVCHREETAFAALVQRHGPAVLAVCRRVLGATGEADDAFQSTFLVLARKADAVWHDSVRNWLCAAAHRQALHIRSEERRRRSRETTADPLHPGLDRPAEDRLLREVTRRELRRLLEEELNGLPEKYRAPMVLCYLEGKTNQEAARQLGWATGSISRRLARARAILRDRPRLRDLAVTVGILGCLLAVAVWPSRPPKEAPVAQVMQQFQGTPHGEPGIEDILHRLESGEPLNPRQVKTLARQTARLVESIRDQRNGPWRQKADAARMAALELAAAAETGERRNMQVAARKLSAACVDCHATYRSW